MPQPSVGRIVHYGTPPRSDGSQAFGSECRAAIITAVDDYQTPTVNNAGQHIGHVDLAVLNPDGVFFNRGVHQADGEHRGGTWHWPEHV